MKEALRRDWEQTKADLTRKRGHDLHQTAADTARQVLGIEPLPGRGENLAGPDRGEARQLIVGEDPGAQEKAHPQGDLQRE